MTTPPGNYEHLKQLEPLIGAWTGEWVLSEDRPTAGIKKGKNLPVTVTYKWDVNKSAILTHVTAGEPGSAPVWGMIWLIGWDTANKRIVCSAFEFTGGHACDARLGDQGRQGDVQSQGLPPRRQQDCVDMVFSDIKKDSFVWQMIDMTVDGRK